MSASRFEGASKNSELTIIGGKPARCRRRAILALGAGLSLSLDASAAQVRILFIPKQVNNPYNGLIFRGIQEAALEVGAEATMIGPDNTKVDSQIPFLDRAIALKPAAIIIAANDQITLLPQLKRASAIGIKIIAVDTDIAIDSRTIFVNQASQEGVGRAQMRLLAQLMEKKGEYAVLSATPISDNQNAWIYWMNREAQQPTYNEMSRVAVVYGNDDPSESIRQAQQLLQDYPELKGIVAPTAVGLVAAARVLEGSRRGIKVTGLGTPKSMRRYLDNGTVAAFQLWNPVNLGYLAFYAAAGAAAGTVDGRRGESLPAGRLGSFQIGSHGEVVLGAPMTFDRANIANFDF